MTVQNSRDDGPPRKRSLEVDLLSDRETVFDMEICGVRHRGVPILPTLEIRALNDLGDLILTARLLNIAGEDEDYGA